MTDLIEIKDLLLRAIVGINPEERSNKQDVLINIQMDVDTREAAANDDIERTVNYRSVAKRVIELVENSEFFLVERLAEEIAATALAEPRVEGVRVSVDKPGAVRFARSVGVTIVRKQSR